MGRQVAVWTLCCSLWGRARLQCLSPSLHGLHSQVFMRWRGERPWGSPHFLSFHRAAVVPQLPAPRASCVGAAAREWTAQVDRPAGSSNRGKAHTVLVPPDAFLLSLELGRVIAPHESRVTAALRLPVGEGT